MAKLTEGPLGAILGKVGTVVGATWKGKPYIRSKGRGRNKKRGAVEQHNQNNFGLIHRWLQPLQPFLQQGFSGYSPTMSTYNAAKSYALKNALTGARGAKVFDPSKVQVSFGDLPLPSQLSMEKLGDLVRFRWDPQVPEGASRYDQAMLLVYNPEQRQYNYRLTGQFRQAGEDELKVPGSDGGVWHVFIAFVAADRSKQSHSLYLGTV